LTCAYEKTDKSWGMQLSNGRTDRSSGWLCINMQQLREGFAIIDRALEIMDKLVES
jgi:hypothetical protein